MPDLVGGQLTGEGVALPPGVQPAVADVVVVVDRADVVARVTAAVPPRVVDGVDARIGPERVAVGCLGVLPGHTDEPGQPQDLVPAHVGIYVDRAVLVVVVEPQQLAVVEPVLLPGGRRVGQLTPRLCLHQVLPPLRALSTADETQALNQAGRDGKTRRSDPHISARHQNTARTRAGAGGAGSGRARWTACSPARSRSGPG